MSQVRGHLRGTKAWGGGMIVVGTWSPENLYRPGGQFGSQDQARVDAKLTTLAGTIAAAPPDVRDVPERRRSRRLHVPVSLIRPN